MTTNMQALRRTLLSGWHPARILRVAVGMIAAVQASLTGDGLLGMAGGFLLFVGITNTGCGASGCGMPAVRAKRPETEETEFEEVRP